LARLPWDKNRYCRIEPRLSEAHFRQENIELDFDEFDVPSNRLILAGEAWLYARKNPQKAELFYGGNREKNKGLWYIRDRLIQDIAALNRVEMQLWDIWGMMHMPEHIFNQAETLNYFDQLAKMTISL
jgi:hypothetical protein